ncbi:HAD family hydrolase [Propionibacteriaceae bacterium Y1700]|uniref:HAD family hydrolase n=1 Tax=Microlunatus sp. Y1700 TaxID=3418487 RepID=UPI003DA75C50
MVADIGALPKIVVTDLDGTFLSPDGSVSKINSDAVAQARRAGITFLVATGRAPRGLDPIRQMPGPNPVSVTSNGAILYDTADDSILQAVTIDPAVAQSVIMDLTEAIDGVTFAFEQGHRLALEPAYRTWDPVDDQPGMITGKALDLVRDRPFVKLLVQHKELTADDLAARAEPVVGDRLTVTHSAASNFGLLEVSAPGVSKASMLDRYCAELGVRPEEVAAFGDMPNDLEMLQWAGHAYAMADCHDSLLGTATVIGSNADSAVGRTITSWLS